MAILAVLVALSLPALSSSRAANRQKHCLLNVRNVGQTFAAYANDFRDAYPFAGHTPRLYNPFPGFFEFAGGVDGIRGGRWSMLFADDWNGDQWNPAQRCPAQPAYAAHVRTGPMTSPVLNGEIPFPLFWLSDAFWLDPDTLRPDSRSEDARPMRIRTSDVMFPSAKVLMYEGMAYCVSEPGALEFTKTFAQSAEFRTQALRADGSALRTRQADGVPANITYPFVRTIHGVRGRDLR